MKILHLNNEKTWRGGERQTLLLAAELQKRGLVNTIACRPKAPLQAQAEQQNVPTFRLSGSTLLAMVDLVKASRQFDLLHCHTGRSHSLATATAWCHRKPIIVTRRVDFLPKHSWFNHRKYLQAAKVVCISEFIAAQLRDWGVPKDKLSVIQSAVPSATNLKSKSELRAQIGLPLDKKIVGNIAALVGHKDHATLLRAARQVVDQRQDVLFVVIGEGELRPELLKLRAQLQLESHVQFLGFVPEAQKYLSAFDVFAMSSCMEGLGSIVLDTFAAGVSVAATAGGGLPELVRDNETGLLVGVGDAPGLAGAILKLLNNETLAKQLAGQAQQWVEQNCSVAKMAEMYMQIYQKVLP